MLAGSKHLLGPSSSATAAVSALPAAASAPAGLGAGALDAGFEAPKARPAALVALGAGAPRVVPREVLAACRKVVQVGGGVGVLAGAGAAGWQGPGGGSSAAG